MISTSELKVENVRPGKVSIVSGLKIIDRKCACGSSMFIHRAPCWMRKQGWAKAVKCLKCGRRGGYERLEEKEDEG
jgi:hypothetical protein